VQDRRGSFLVGVGLAGLGVARGADGLLKQASIFLLVGSFPAPERADFIHLQPAVAVGGSPLRPCRVVKEKHSIPYFRISGVCFGYASLYLCFCFKNHFDIAKKSALSKMAKFGGARSPLSKKTMTAGLVINDNSRGLSCHYQE